MTLLTLLENSRFTRDLDLLTLKVGLPHALSEMFNACRIKLNFRGDTSWADDGRGVLLVGSHRIGVEIYFLMATLSRFGRRDVRVIGNPLVPGAAYLMRRDLHQVGYALPVVPSVMARDRSYSSLDDTLFWRTYYGDRLPTLHECQTTNESSLHEAALFLEERFIVNIFPSGNMFVKTDLPWKPGIGRILKKIRVASRDRILVVPYSIEGFSLASLAHSIGYYCLGFEHAEKEVDLIFGTQKVLGDLTGMETDPRVLTELVQEFYTKTMVSVRR